MLQMVEDVTVDLVELHAAAFAVSWGLSASTFVGQALKA
jgi:hypothetical protein